MHALNNKQEGSKAGRWMRRYSGFVSIGVQGRQTACCVKVADLVSLPESAEL
jgi:hypothetical protein